LNFNSADVGNASQPLLITGDEEAKVDTVPTAIVIATQASNSTVNVPFSKQPLIRFVGPNGQTVPVTGYIVTSYVSGAPGNLLPLPNTTGSSINGFVLFSGLYVDTAGEFTLNFNSADVGNASQGLNISSDLSSGVPSAIVIATPATSPSVIGTPFAVQPRIRFVDAHGGTYPVTGYKVTASISPTMPGYQGVLEPTASCTAYSVNGFVFFNSLYVSGEPGQYLLNFNSADVGNCSQAIVLDASTEQKVEHKKASPSEKPTKLVCTPASSPSVVNVSFKQQPSLRLADAKGETVPLNGVKVTATLSGPPGSSIVGVLLPSQNCIATSVAGYVFFTGLYVAGSTGEYTINYNCADVGDASQKISIVDS